MALRVALTGGGTGGHTFPIVAVAKAVQEQEPKTKFLWLGSKKGPEQTVAQQAEIEFSAIAVGKIRRYFSFSNVSDLLKIPLGVVKAYFVLATFRPHVLFSKGGYVSYPTVIAAWLHDIPILLHETDSVPGLANRRVVKKATLIAQSFPKIPVEFPKRKTIITGLPIRRELLQGSAERARQAFGLTDERPVLLILGGSQGARSVNKVIQKILPDLLVHYQIIHQVGPKNVEQNQELADKYRDQGYHMAGFFTDELADVFAGADVIVSRAGGQIHELAALGKPVLLLPLASAASNHQVLNAAALEKEGAAIALEEANLTPSLLLDNLLDLVRKTDLRLSLGNNIKKFDKPLAAKKIAYWLLRLAKLR